MSFSVNVNDEFRIRQAYGRHGRRHGLKGVRPNRVLMSEVAYARGYLFGRILRLAGQCATTVAIAFIVCVILVTLPDLN